MACQPSHQEADPKIIERHGQCQRDDGGHHQPHQGGECPWKPARRQALTQLGEAARLLKALANEKRLLLLCKLVEGERSVSELNASVDRSQSALSQHLAVLRSDKLVSTRREAQTIYYSLAPGPAQQVL